MHSVKKEKYLIALRVVPYTSTLLHLTFAHGKPPFKSSEEE